LLDVRDLLFVLGGQALGVLLDGASAKALHQQQQD
jgi:hypothetical protein